MKEVYNSPACVRYFGLMQIDEAAPNSGVKHFTAVAEYGDAIEEGRGQRPRALGVADTYKLKNFFDRTLVAGITGTADPHRR